MKDIKRFHVNCTIVESNFVSREDSTVSVSNSRTTAESIFDLVMQASHSDSKEAWRSEMSLDKSSVVSQLTKSKTIEDGDRPDILIGSRLSWHRMTLGGCCQTLLLYRLLQPTAYRFEVREDNNLEEANKIIRRISIDFRSSLRLFSSTVHTEI